MTKILYGKNITDFYADKMKKEIEDLELKPTLAIIVAKDYSKASSIYVKNKYNFADKIGIKVLQYDVEWENKSKEELEEHLTFLITDLNNASNIHGIIVQLPFPLVDENYISNLISPLKDVDGFTINNLGALMRNEEGLYSCTPLGAMKLLEYYNIKVEGKICCVVGRSNILGKPLTNLLINKGGTIISCNSKTKDLKAMTKQADIVFLAVGKAMFDKTYFKKDAIVIDFGMNRNSENKLCGDLIVDNVQDVLSAYTPCPGGTGLITVMSLMLNTIEACKKQLNFRN